MLLAFVFVAIFFVTPSAKQNFDRTYHFHGEWHTDRDSVAQKSHVFRLDAASFRENSTHALLHGKLTLEEWFTSHQLSFRGFFHAPTGVVEFFAFAHSVEQLVPGVSAIVNQSPYYSFLRATHLANTEFAKKSASALRWLIPANSPLCLAYGLLHAVHSPAPTAGIFRFVDSGLKHDLSIGGSLIYAGPRCHGNGSTSDSNHSSLTPTRTHEITPTPVIPTHTPTPTSTETDGDLPVYPDVSSPEVFVSGSLSRASEILAFCRIYLFAFVVFTVLEFVAASGQLDFIEAARVPVISPLTDAHNFIFAFALIHLHIVMYTLYGGTLAMPMYLCVFLRLYILMRCDSRVSTLVWRQTSVTQSPLASRCGVLLWMPVAIVVIFSFWPNTAAIVVLSSGWVPQIYKHYIEDSTMSYTGLYLLACCLSRVLVLAYFLLFDNVLGIATNESAFWVCTAWHFATIAVIFSQFAFGPRWFLPSFFVTTTAPKQYEYDYWPVSVPLSATASRCSICLTEVDVDSLAPSERMLTPCNHLFHTDCLLEWYDTKPDCPACRTSLPDVGPVPGM